MAERVYVKDVLARLQNHIQRHTDKCDPMLERHDIILFGELGDNGIVREIQEMSKLKTDIKQLKWLLITAVAIEIAMRFLPA